MSSRDANNQTSTGFPEEIQITSSFDDMSLDMQLLRGIYGYGWEEPTGIQQRTIVPMKDGRDILAQAQSGKGKTGAFTVASLSIADASLRQTHVLILAPTRELAMQSREVAENLSINMDGMSVALCIGGTRVKDNVRELQRNPAIVVGTPGRINHMIQNGALEMKHLRCIVLDEADEMLDRGFREIMYDIFQYCPEEVQVCLFSATYNKEVLEVANRFCRNPFRILIKKESVTLDGIKQFYVDCEQEHFKLGVLTDLYECLSISQVIIFVNTVARCEQLYNAMTAQDFTCSFTHGSMDWEERTLRMKEFRSGASRVLISTELMARGIDVANVGIVINYDLPHDDFSVYIHRIGRSGRHGKKGVAINFITDDPRDHQTIRELERYYCTKINELPADLASLD